jgi:hypothetical protein
MSMLTLNGQIINVFETPSGINKEGKNYGGQHRIQIMAENELQNGQKRVELINLTVDTIAPFKSLLNQMVRIPVGIFVQEKSANYYMLKNAKPEVIPSSSTKSI